MGCTCFLTEPSCTRSGFSINGKQLQMKSCRECGFGLSTKLHKSTSSIRTWLLCTTAGPPRWQPEPDPVSGSLSRALLQHLAPSASASGCQQHGEEQTIFKATCMLDAGTLDHHTALTAMLTKTPLLAACSAPLPFSGAVVRPLWCGRGPAGAFAQGSCACFGLWPDSCLVGPSLSAACCPVRTGSSCFPMV